VSLRLRPVLSYSLTLALREKGWVFYTFIGSGHCRFMCSWATTEADITALTNDIQEITDNG
jgi:threonine aldolase